MLGKNKGSKSIVLIGIFALVLFVGGITGNAKEEWPTRPINLICGWAAGGGTDTVDRFLAAEMEKILGQPIAVSNMTGGMAGIAGSYVMNAKKDGYLWWGCGDQFYAQAVMGGHPSTVKDWHIFFGFGARDLISVRSDSPYESFEDLLKAVRERPGEFKIAASGIATHMHIATVVLKKFGNFPVEIIPYPGSYKSQLALLRKEVDIVHTTISEQLDYIKGGKIKPLVAVDIEPHIVAGREIPSIIKFIPEVEPYLPIPQAVGFCVPKGVPIERVKKIEAAFKKVMMSEAAKKFSEKMRLPILGSAGWYGEIAVEKMWPPTKIASWLYYELGLAEKSPEEFNIPKPE